MSRNDINKHSLVIEQIGSGEPLVLFHGWGFHSGVWQPLIPLLSSHYQLIMVDLPGFGKNQSYVVDYDLNHLLTTLKDALPSQAAYLGWSLGGMLAMGMALQYPNTVSKLFTLASSPKFLAQDQWPGVEESKFMQFRTAISIMPKMALQQFVNWQLRGSTTTDDKKQQVTDLLFHYGTPPKWALLGGLDLLASIDYREQLTSLTCPQIHLYGEHDALVPNQITQVLSSYLSRDHLITIPDSGHYFFWQHAEKVAAIITGAKTA